MNDAVKAWMFGDDTGLSSQAIVAFFEGIPAGSWGYSHPLDPADLGRCLRLLAIAPEYKTRLSEMSNASLEWAALIPHWNELESLYQAEFENGRAPKCYARMRELLDAVPPSKGKFTIHLKPDIKQEK